MLRAESAERQVATLGLKQEIDFQPRSEYRHSITQTHMNHLLSLAYQCEPIEDNQPASQPADSTGLQLFPLEPSVEHVWLAENRRRDKSSEGLVFLFGSGSLLADS